MNDSNTNSKKDSLVSVSIMAAAVLIAGAIIYSVSVRSGPSGGGQEAALLPEKTEDSANFVNSVLEIKSTDIVLGVSDAPVTWIEYGDFQCPFCMRLFTAVHPLLKEEFVRPGKVKMIWRDFAFLGEESNRASLAAHCAGDQGKFWEYHDTLHEVELRDGRENNGNLSEAKLKTLASTLKLEQKQFEECLDSGKYQEIIRTSYAEAVKAGVKATPTVFINGEMFEGALSFDFFKNIIEAQLQNS